MHEYEIGIIGGGPAGSSLATYLANEGISCILLEKETFPRPHVGESLVPAANRVLNEIGVLEKIEAAGFPRKFGAAWTADGQNIYAHDWEGIPADCKVDIRFDERQMYGDQNYTYHVDRAKFDKILLDHAKENGANIIEGALVQRIQFGENGIHDIHYSINGTSKNVRVKLVVDASGRNTKLGSQLKIKVKDENFDQLAIHSWFKDFDRGEGENREFIFIHFLPLTHSWIWQIPITEDITSIGVVTQKKHFLPFSKNREEFFWKCFETHPDMLNRMKNAERVTDFKTEGDYSYHMDSFCGDGWVLIGDAARFVDPIFSSGVSVALNSSRFLIEDIKNFYQAKGRDTFKKEDFLKYERTLKNGTRNWYRFISLYYRLNVIFTKFIYDKKYRLDVLELLSGDVYDEEYPEVLTKMEEFISKVEQNPNHILHPLLSDLKSQSFPE